MPSSSFYETHQQNMNDDLDENEIQELIQRPNEISPWVYKRNSPLCDYRLQFRPLPLTSALCGYGHNTKDGPVVQMNPFKYG